MKYKVKINNSNKFHGLTRDLFEEGEEVIFHVPFVTDVNTYVTSQDVRLELLPNEDSLIKYRFIMPAHDVYVDVSFRGGMTCMHHNIPQDMPIMGMMGMQMQQNMNPVPPPPIGKQDSKFCPECGAVIPKTAKYCSSCGVKCES